MSKGVCSACGAARCWAVQMGITRRHQTSHAVCFWHVHKQPVGSHFVWFSQCFSCPSSQKAQLVNLCCCSVDALLQHWPAFVASLHSLHWKTAKWRNQSTSASWLECLTSWAPMYFCQFENFWSAAVLKLRHSMKANYVSVVWRESSCFESAFKCGLVFSVLRINSSISFVAHQIPTIIEQWQKVF